MRNNPLKRLHTLVKKRDTLREALGWVRNRHPGRIFGNDKIRNDLQVFPVCDGAQLEVYWKELPIGIGTTALVRIFGEEILRLDCFEGGKGHIHTASFLPPRKESKRPPRKEIALELPEKSIVDQIERVAFELGQNIDYYKARSANPRIRHLVMDQNTYGEAVMRAKKQLLSFAQLHCT